MASGEGNNNRPFSLSKDEQLARMLQEEEYNAVNHEDEQLARRLQGNMMFDSDEDSSHLGAGNRPPLRAMTPITQLFTTLVNAGLHQHPRQTRRSLGLLQLSSDEEANNSDSDSTVDDEPDTGRTGTSVISSSSSSSLIGRGRGAARGTSRSTTRGRMGYRPTETTVSVSSGRNVPSESPRSMFSTSSDPPSSRTTTTTTIRGNRLTRGGAATRGTRRPRRGSTTISESSESRPNAAATSQLTSRPPASLRSVPPLSMEPSVPPLSLAINQPELPDGEVEPEIVILDRGPGGNDGFLHIMRDPMLLLLFLMGRTPHLLVPDDIDPTDYEALWDLAERLGEVKHRGLSDKELDSLSTKKYRAALKTTKVNAHVPQCQVCLTEYKSGENLVNLPCKHEYHDKCIKEWLKRNASCPICRHELKSDSKEKS